MDIWITIKVAIKALMKSKMRTFLTMLGIIIGVGAVIGMLSIARGAQYNITRSIESLGTNVLFIIASAETKGGVRGGWGSITTLKVDDSEAIQKECQHIKYSSPMITVMGRVIHKNQNWGTQVNAVNEHFQYINDLNMSKGNFFGAQETTSASKVCVIGPVVQENLFAWDENPVGKTIRINRIPFKVIGILESKGSSGGNKDQDDVIFIPYSTAMQRMYRKDYIMMIMASATSRDDVALAKEEVTQLLKQRHRIKPGQDDDFMIHTLEEIMKMVGEFTKTFTILLGAIASVSLLVGGIGIMNIMLVSVTERIREIGIRMAIGARPRDILCQFLIEALVLSLAGGIMGIGLGYLISLIIGMIAKWPSIITPSSVLLALTFASGVGIFFGFYPAWKASRLDPIQALRHE